MVGVVFFDYWVSVGVAVVYPFSLLVLNSSIDFFCKQIACLLQYFACYLTSKPSLSFARQLRSTLRQTRSFVRQTRSTLLHVSFFRSSDAFFPLADAFFLSSDAFYSTVCIVLSLGRCVLSFVRINFFPVNCIRFQFCVILFRCGCFRMFTFRLLTFISIDYSQQSGASGMGIWGGGCLCI